MSNIDISELSEGVSKQFTSFDLKTRKKTICIPPNEKRTLVDSKETGVATRLWVTFPGWFWQHWNENALVDQKILRTTILRIYFDSNEYPSIEAPIGDFFGVGHCEYRHYTSKYLGMSSGGFYCYLPMPFENGIKVEIENRHETESIDMFFNMNVQLFDSLKPNSTRLHCAFNSGTNSGIEPLEIIDTTGKGHFVGCCVSIQGEPMNYLSYLEAPEYIWIDGETGNPTIVGTGMEDYFNGGWYFRNGEFYCSTHGVTLKDTLRSMVTMYRFHEEDKINFQTKMKMSFINPWDGERLKPFSFSSTGYYYLTSAQPSCYRISDTKSLDNTIRKRDVDFHSVP